jgi:ribosomal-protein-alanine N-acetyltransferase
VNDIETDRLLLRLVPLSGLAAIAAKDEEACTRIIGKLPQEWFEDAWVAELRLHQWEEDPAYAPWSIRAVILKSTGEIIGGINCHDQPRLMEHGGETGLSIEMGYTIYDPWRRNGYAYETIAGLGRFAAGQEVRWVKLSISPENQPSLQLAKKLGAEKIGSQIDEIDGLEDIYLFEI